MTFNANFLLSCNMKPVKCFTPNYGCGGTLMPTLFILLFMYLRFLYSNDSLPKPLGGKYTFIFGIHSMSFFFYYYHKFTFYISCSVLSVFCLDKSCKWVALAMEEGKCCQNQICTLKERWHECLVKGSWCIHQEKSATAWALHTLQKTMWSIKTLIWPRC